MIGLSFTSSSEYAANMLIKSILPAICFLLATAQACFAWESGWVGNDYAKARLVLIQDERADGEGEVQIEFRLADGWVTYQNDAENKGIPPNLDWEQSTNMASADVDWPEPEEFEIWGSTVTGYAEDVTWPVHITAIDAQDPVSISLSLDYAICQEVCIPMSASFEVPEMHF